MGKLHDIFIDHYGEVLLIPDSDMMEHAIKAVVRELIEESFEIKDEMTFEQLRLRQLSVQSAECWLLARIRFR